MLNDITLTHVYDYLIAVHNVDALDDICDVADIVSPEAGLAVVYLLLHLLDLILVVQLYPGAGVGVPLDVAHVGRIRCFIQASSNCAPASVLSVFASEYSDHQSESVQEHVEERRNKVLRWLVISVLKWLPLGS